MFDERLQSRLCSLPLGHVAHRPDGRRAPLVGGLTDREVPVPRLATLRYEPGVVGRNVVRSVHAVRRDDPQTFVVVRVNERPDVDTPEFFLGVAGYLAGALVDKDERSY